MENVPVKDQDSHTTGCSLCVKGIGLIQDIHGAMSDIKVSVAVLSTKYDNLEKAVLAMPEKVEKVEGRVDALEDKITFTRGAFAAVALGVTALWSLLELYGKKLFHLK